MRKKVSKFISKKVCKRIGILLFCILVIMVVFHSGLGWNLASRFIGWDVKWNPWKNAEVGADFQVDCSENMNEIPFGGSGYYIQVLASEKDRIVIQTSQGILVPWDGCSPEDLESGKKKKYKVTGSDSYTFAWGAEGEHLSKNTYFLVTAYRNGMVRGRGLIRFTGKKDESQNDMWRGTGKVIYQQDYTKQE